MCPYSTRLSKISCADLDDTYPVLMVMTQSLTAGNGIDRVILKVPKPGIADAESARECPQNEWLCTGVNSHGFFCSLFK
jgi:hypothetical protein